MHVLKTVSRYLFYTIAGLIFLWLIVLVVLKAFNLEFIRESHEELYFGAGVFLLPLLILSWLLKNLKPNDKWYVITGKVSLGVILSLIFFFIIAASSLSGMCQWTTANIALKNKASSNIQIVERHYGCGATDSSPATKRFFKSRTLAGIFVEYTAVNLSVLDMNDWLVIK